MAKILGVFKNWSGKCGSIIYSNWKSIQDVRNYTNTVNPGYPDQLAQQDRFKKMYSNFYSMTSDFINTAWKFSNIKNRTPFNNFLSWNIQREYTSPDNYIQLTRGSLETICPSSFTFSAITNKFTLEWKTAICSNGTNSDNIICCIFEDDTLVCYSYNEFNRSDGSIEFSFPAYNPAKTYSCLISCFNTLLFISDYVLTYSSTRFIALS